MKRAAFVDLVAGKRIAVIGRAGSIQGTGHGAEIDAADVVIRVNWVLPIPDDQRQDVGARTDLLYHCRRAKVAARTAKSLGIAKYRASGKRRKRMARRHFNRPNSFRPTTGFMCVLECLSGGAEEVRLYGFDVFRSGHIQERDPEGHNTSSPLRWSHNPEEERVAWKKLFARNGKVKPDKILRRAIR